VDENGRPSGSTIYAPDVTLTSLGRGGESYFVHAKEFWKVGVTLGEPPPDGSFLLPITVEGFQPSQRASEANAKLLYYKWFQVLGEPLPSEEELEARLQEGRWLRYEGAVYFEEISCSVPVNTADPIGWAKAMAKRELGMTEFGRCHVLGADWKTESSSPETA